MLYTDLNSEINVGASAHLLEFGKFKALVDCGVHPKLMGNASLPKLDLIGDDTLDFIAVTHAHLDHCGALPVLARRQRAAQIMSGEGSAELILRMLRNSKNVMMRQRAEYNITEYPFYEFSALDALAPRIATMQNFVERSFPQDGDSAKIGFYPAGHVFGASSVVIEHGKTRVFFSGDMCFNSTPLLKGAVPPQGRLDIMVMECTRGDYFRPEGQTYQTEVQRLISYVGKILSEGGSVLIPVFALGRMQEILNILHSAQVSGRLPKFPIFSGGLGVDIAEHIARCSKKYSQFHFGKNCLDNVKPLRQEIIPGQDFDTKGIYLLGSGMMTPNTPSYAAAAALLEQKGNAIYFVGYSDPDSPAGKLLKWPRNGDFSFPELSYVGKVNCRVNKFDLSSHAERDEILSFILEKDPRCVILTHGSVEAREWFMYEILDISPKTQVIIATPGVSYDI